MEINTRKIVSLCAKRSWGVGDLCRSAKISRATWMHIKNGGKVHMVTLGNIAAALQVEPEELLKEE